MTLWSSPNLCLLMLLNYKTKSRMWSLKGVVNIGIPTKVKILKDYVLGKKNWTAR